MKQILQQTTFRLLLAAFLLSFLPGTVIWGQGTLPSGNGSSAGDPYQISTRDHLEWIADQVENNSETFNGKFLKLQNDIDLGDSYWTPIGSDRWTKCFAGTFDGDGYKISGLSIQVSIPGVYSRYVGFFGNVGQNSVIKNLCVEIAKDGMQMDGTCEWQYSRPNRVMGGITGYANNCTIENCYVTGGRICLSGDLPGTSTGIGGIAGEAQDATIQNCYATIDLCFDGGNISRSDADDAIQIAGIVGVIRSTSTITNCYYSGTITARAVNNNSEHMPWHIAGIATDARNATISNCLVLSREINTPITPAPPAFIFFVDAIGGKLSPSTNYVSPQTTINGAVPGYDNAANGTEWTNSTDAAAPISTWTGTGKWAANSYEKCMPFLKMEDGNPFKNTQPYVSKRITSISTATDLAAINMSTTSLGADYILANDIDLTDYISANGGSWKSIGNEATPFLGTFDGNGYRITGLAIAEGSSNGEDEGGLFGKVGTYGYAGPEIVIKNLGVEIAESGIHINTTINKGGGIATKAHSCKIQNCYVTGGAVYGVGAGRNKSLALGGIIGYLNVGATIEHCYSTVDIIKEWDNPVYEMAMDESHAGGIVGEASNGTINNCFATGAVSLIVNNATEFFNINLGGIAGFNAGTINIANCLAANSGGITATSARLLDIKIDNIMGTKGHGTYTNNYTLSDIPKTAGVGTTDGLAGTDWDGISAYPTGIFNNDNWQISTTAESVFPKLCYAGTNIPMPNQQDVIRPYKVDATTPAVNGTLSVDCKVYAKAGEVVTITTVPEPGYAADLPTVTGITRASTPIPVTPGATNEYTFTMPASPVTITATFHSIFTVTVDNAITNGSIDVKMPDGTSLNPGTNAGIKENTQLTIIATPANGYRLKTLKANGSSITGTTYTVTATVILSAEFEPTPGGDDGEGPTHPTVYHTVTLPAVEGATTDPVAGDYDVEAWGSFRFHLSVDKEYDLSVPVVTTSLGETITPSTSNGAYIIKYIHKPLNIFIDGIVKNSDPVGNEAIATDVIKVWKTGSYLHIQATTDGQGYIYTPEGKLQTVCKLIAGEVKTIQLPMGIYFIRIGNEQFKIVL